RIKRICISMITHKKAVEDTKIICRKLRNCFDIPVSLLISPTILNRGDLYDFKSAGADKIGVAVDLATPELFDRFRGSGVGGPHRWETYWRFLEDAVSVFGRGNAGSHLMVGMGETEKEMCAAIQRTRDLGGNTHLFSYFPETGSTMDDHRPPPMGQYRRIQLAQFIIDRDIGRAERFDYRFDGSIAGYDIPRAQMDAFIDSGEPFRTTGCTGHDGQVACNRPFGNSRPGPLIRNYPFPPEAEDILRIRRQIESA
ncbi:MAG: radical SAM protein, partial [Desulfobacteraceae bacterium]